VLLAALSVNADPQNLLLEFSADWCEPCQQMGRIVSRLERQGSPIRKIDIDRNRDLMHKYRIEGIPTFVLIVDGKEVDRVVGMTSETRLKRMLAKIRTPSPQSRKRSRNPVMIAKEAPKPFVPIVKVAQGTKKKKPRFPIPFFNRSSRDREVEIEPVSTTNGPRVVRAKLDDTDLPQKPVRTSVAPLPWVRIRVLDNGFTNFASGTVIESSPRRTLLLTCGHVLRDLSKNAEIDVDTFSSRQPAEQLGTYRGEIVDYDLKADVGLLAIRAEEPLAVSMIAGRSERIARGKHVISVGCSRGEEPTRLQHRITALNRYGGPANVECTGVPVQGRSGGGLFTTSGKLIAVCIAADPRDKRGLYAGLEAVHGLLERSGLAHLCNDNDGKSNSSSPDSADSAGETLAVASAQPRQPSRPPQYDAATAPPLQATSHNQELGSGDFPPASTEGNLERTQAICAVQEQEQEAEVICIIRPLGRQQAASRVVIINRASPKFMNYLSDELQDQPHATMHRVRTADQTFGSRMPTVATMLAEQAPDVPPGSRLCDRTESFPQFASEDSPSKPQELRGGPLRRRCADQSLGDELPSAKPAHPHEALTRTAPTNSKTTTPRRYRRSAASR
jgi:thiol-disulfide isomerase/thioredoxin